MNNNVDVKSETKVLTPLELEALWSVPYKPRCKRKFLWTMGEEPQGRVKAFGEGSSADARLVLGVRW